MPRRTVSVAAYIRRWPRRQKPSWVVIDSRSSRMTALVAIDPVAGPSWTPDLAAARPFFKRELKLSEFSDPSVILLKVR